MTDAPVSLAYPAARRSDHTDDYHGTSVADPYRWLEDPDSAETVAFVEAQNRLTRSVLGPLPLRQELQDRLTALWNYERRGAPWERSGKYFQFRNSGLQNQNVLYVMDTPEGEGRVLLDPNTLSEDGTAALNNLAVSPDGSRLAYAVSSGGSDWQEWWVRDVETGADLPGHLPDSKFSGAAWLPDSSGFFYSRYDHPEGGYADTAATFTPRIWLHRLGSEMQADELIQETPDHPEWRGNASVTEDGAYLVVTVTHGTARANLLWVRPLAERGAFTELVGDFSANYEVVGNDGPELYVLTDEDAPLSRLLAWNVETGTRRELVPEGPDRLDSALSVRGGFVLHTLQDASSRLTLTDREGQQARPVALPGLGTVAELRGHQDSAEVFVGFTSFLTPGASYRLNLDSATLGPLWQADLGLGDYEVRQEFATSADGTRVPFFLVGRREALDGGPRPTLLYGYGGFDISLTPTFSVSRLAWLERGALLAVANLRGGGEYGESWHRAGTLGHKQNVFDDFAACARHLADHGYTTPRQLAIEGGSNGGLLVGATLVQHPELIGAAVAHVGVLDMLRFQKFTIGWAWVSDYGSSDTPQGFEVLRAYSPLHTLKPGRYPATLITTGDHDDRVVPAHSYKFAAQLQRDQQSDAPVLLRVQTRAGHGAGKPARLVIEEMADMYAFLFGQLGGATS